MPIRKGNHSKRRHMYFRESSKRDPAISQEEEAKRYDMAICQYCGDCMYRYTLEKGRVPRRIGICGICGNDGFITGSIYSKDPAIILAKRISGAIEKTGVKNV